MTQLRKLTIRREPGEKVWTASLEGCVQRFRGRTIFEALGKMVCFFPDHLLNARLRACDALGRATIPTPVAYIPYVPAVDVYLPESPQGGEPTPPVCPPEE